MNSDDPGVSKFHRVVCRIAFSAALSCVLLWLVTSALSVSRAGAAAALEETQMRPQAALARLGDPVVISGTRFAAFTGVPLNELVMYSYRGGEWAPIPFQIDEVNISGTYVTSDDGWLGGRDEVVFVAGDAGDNAGAANWPPDIAARLNSRYAITVSDPLNAGQQAWAYLYRSPTLTRSNFSYITWTYATQTASAVSYTAAFSPTRFVGLSDLFINGGNADILDRQKTRLATLFTALNEESIVSLLGPATMTLPIAGPVRAATNSGDLRAAFYGSRLDFDVTFNLGGIPLPINAIRTSFDWISPTLSGIHTYYDSNTPGGVAIDGVPDAVATTPRTTWFQVGGGQAGPGGLVMAIPRVNPQGGTVTNYYKDNSASDANDTGDRRSFGDAGLLVNSPGTIVSFTLIAYILPPGTNTNVGAVYFAHATNPLQAVTARQCDTPTAECIEIKVPPIHVAVTGPTLARINYPHTYVAGVSPLTTSLPLTYIWQATDYSPVTVPGEISAGATFTWTTTGFKTISVTAYNSGGWVSSDPLSVWVGRFLFLPLILKNAP